MQIKNRAEREGGQVLVTESENAQGASDLHALSSGTDNTISPETEKARGGTEKSSKKVDVSQKVFDGIREISMLNQQFRTAKTAEERSALKSRAQGIADGDGEYTYRR